MAVDYKGNVLAYQDFFETSDPIMVVDAPTQGVKTLYGMLGDWFAYLNIALLIVVAGSSILYPYPRNNSE